CFLDGVRPTPTPTLFPYTTLFRSFFATAVSITAIPIMGRILMHTRLARTRMGLTAITAAALDDALGWLLLGAVVVTTTEGRVSRSEEHTSELQSRGHLVCRLLLEK